MQHLLNSAPAGVLPLSAAALVITSRVLTMKKDQLIKLVPKEVEPKYLDPQLYTADQAINTLSSYDEKARAKAGGLCESSVILCERGTCSLVHLFTCSLRPAP